MNSDLVSGASASSTESSIAPGTRMIAHAVAVNLGFSFATILVQLITFGILARLLTPEDYGIFALANSILVYISHLTQRGLSSSLLRKPHMTRVDYGSAYLVCAIIAVCGACITFAIASLIMLVMPQLSRQAELLMFMSVPLFLQIVATPAQVLLQRNLRMLTANLVQLASILIGNGAVGILLAWNGAGPWALAFGAAGAALTTLVISLVVARATITTSWSWSTVRTNFYDMLHFNFLRSLDIAWLQAPTIVLSPFGATAAVGVYQRMQFLADLGMQLTIWRITSVLYAALARRSDGLNIDKLQYRNVFTLCTLLVLPTVSFVIMSAPGLVVVLLGRQWEAGSGTLQLLIVAFGLNTINHAAGMALEHAGRLRARSIQSGFGLALVLSMLPIAGFLGPKFYAVPALVSMMLSTILLHIKVGERLKDLPSLGAHLLPGTLLATAVLLGSLLASLIGMHLSLPEHGPLELAFQFGMSILVCVLSVPLLFRLPTMQPMAMAFASAFPGTFARTRFLHRSDIVRGAGDV